MLFMLLVTKIMYSSIVGIVLFYLGVELSKETKSPLLENVSLVGLGLSVIIFLICIVVVIFNKIWT